MVPQERVQWRTVDPFVDVPIPQIAEEIAAVCTSPFHKLTCSTSSCLRSWRKREQLCVSHLVSAVKGVETSVPPISKEFLAATQFTPDERVQERIAEQSGIFVVLPTKKEMVHVVQVTPREHGQERIVKHSLNTAAPPRTEDIAKVVQLTNHEMQQMEERIAKCCDDRVRPKKQ